MKFICFALLGISLILLMGCCDLTTLFQNESGYILNDSDDDFNANTGANDINDTDANDTDLNDDIIYNDYTPLEDVVDDIEDLSDGSESPAYLSNGQFVCLDEYRDDYLMKQDPYYCITKTVSHTLNITLCEFIPLNESDSLKRCIRVVAASYAPSKEWCSDNLYRNESIDMCIKMMLAGHKYGSY